jgi:hypothetical protein
MRFAFEFFTLPFFKFYILFKKSHGVKELRVLVKKSVDNIHRTQNNFTNTNKAVEHPLLIQAYYYAKIAEQMKDKILIIDIKKTEITSVENISRNLVKSYQLLKNKDYDIEHFVLDDLSRTAPALNNYNPFFDSIVKNPPQLVAFTHSYIVRTYFFKILIQLLNKEKTTLIFHIYGDFLRQAFKYTEVEKRLLNFRIHFISPSRSYLNLLSTLFKDKRDIKVIEFAVDYKNFFYTNKQRQDIRKKNRNRGKMISFLYILVGFQVKKNVHHLWSIIEKLQITNPKLLIIGSFCDFENATFGTSLILGSSFADCENFFTNKNIIFLSHQNTQEINNYYSASDMFISASLFHDEDFGLRSN